MKVSDYIPLFGLLWNYEYITGIEGKVLTVNELFENYPDFELTENHVNQLELFDFTSLSIIFENDYFTSETVIPYLRNLFDEYRQSGGCPKKWLEITFESVNLNPQIYRAELRATIERCLIEWREIFTKQHIDYLYHNTNSRSKKPVLAAEVIATFCNIVNDTGVMIRKEGESATNYCKRVGKFFTVDINKSVRKYLHNVPSKGNMEIVLNIIVSHIEDNTIKEKITTYINKKLSA